MSIKSLSIFIAVLLVGLIPLAPVRAQDKASAEQVAAMPPMEPRPFDWTGFYAGLQAGGGWDTQKYTYALNSTSQNVKGSGFVAGGTAGYNWRTGPWVYGFEGDISFAHVSGSTTASFLGTPCYVQGCTSNLSWFGTARLRGGYAIGAFLPYITGGAAVGRIKGSADIGACGTATCSYATMRAGWTAGTGVEWRFCGDWSAKLEYLYTQLDAPGFTNVGVTSSNFAFNVVRTGVNLHF